MSCRQACLDITCLLTLLIALGGSGASLGLLQANTENGFFCNFFITESQAKEETFNYNNGGSCKLSMACVIIATISISILSLIELVRVVFQANTRSHLCANIFQVVLLTTSIVCLIVTTAVVATGWAVTCKTFKEVQDDNNNTPYQSFSCTGYQYQNAPPHGGEIIATAIFAGFTIPLLMATAIMFAIRYRFETVRRHYQYTIQQQEALDIIDTPDVTDE